MQPTQLPASFYTEPSQFKLEQNRILERHWLVLGHVGMVSNGQTLAEADWFEDCFARQSS